MDDAGRGLGLTLKIEFDSAKQSTCVSLFPTGNANLIPPHYQDLQKSTFSTGKPQIPSLHLSQERLSLRKPRGLFLKRPKSNGLAVDRWPMLYRQIYQPAHFDLHNATLALTTWNRGERQSAQTGASVFEFDGGRLALISRKRNFSSNFLRYTQQMHLARGSQPKLINEPMSDTAVILPRRQKGVGMSVTASTASQTNRETVAAQTPRSATVTVRDPLRTCPGNLGLNPRHVLAFSPAVANSAQQYKKTSGLNLIVNYFQSSYKALASRDVMTLRDFGAPGGAS